MSLLRQVLDRLTQARQRAELSPFTEVDGAGLVDQRMLNDPVNAAILRIMWHNSYYNHQGSHKRTQIWVSE